MKRKVDVETWALRIIDQLQANRPREDSRVELKREWTRPSKVARQIAGHANAARGEDILWLVGVDEKARTVPGVEAIALEDWWAQVKAEFNELPPPMMDLVVPVEGVHVSALLFETDRAPFVVRNPEGGAIGYEVPWREGTAVRSATRAELLRLLAPIQRQPLVEVLDLELQNGVSPASPVPWWRILAKVYVVPPGSDRIVFPHHHQRAQVEFPGRKIVAFQSVRAGSSTATAIKTAGELVLPFPATIEINAYVNFSDPVEAGPALVELHLRAAGAERPVALSVRVEPTTPGENERARWRMAVP